MKKCVLYINYNISNIGDFMPSKFISRPEEFILLAVLRLKDNAYGVTIRNQIREATGKTWAHGALFVMLDRLEKKGYLTSSFTDPTPQRGGKSKRIFQLLPEGINALEKVRKAHASVWAGIDKLSVSK